MTTSIKDKANLIHIMECIEALPSYRSYLEPGQKWHDVLIVKEATLRTLHTLAESCMRLSPEAKALAPEIPWEKIA